MTPEERAMREAVAGERELAAHTVCSMLANADDLESLGLFTAANLLRGLSGAVAKETGTIIDGQS